jgi:hypothetical protein
MKKTVAVRGHNRAVVASKHLTARCVVPEAREQTMRVDTHSVMIEVPGRYGSRGMDGS